MGPGPYSLTYSRCLTMLDDASINKIANFASIFRARHAAAEGGSQNNWAVLMPVQAILGVALPLYLHLSKKLHILVTHAFHQFTVVFSTFLHFFAMMFQILKSATGTAGACPSRPEVSQERMTKGKCGWWFIFNMRKLLWDIGGYRVSMISQLKYNCGFNMRIIPLLSIYE